MGRHAFLCGRREPFSHRRAGMAEIASYRARPEWAIERTGEETTEKPLDYKTEVWARTDRALFPKENRTQDDYVVDAPVLRLKNRGQVQKDYRLSNLAITIGIATVATHVSPIRATFPYITLTVIPTLRKDLAALCPSDN